MPTLTLIRGLPGSGKSTLAKELDAHHFEADMFHVVNGYYEWDKAMLPFAHKWCLGNAAFKMHRNEDVVVSNTFLQAWQFKEYLQLAEILNYEVTIIDCQTNFGSDHDVPQETMERMIKQYDSIEDLREKLKDYDGVINYEQRIGTVG